MANIQKRPDGRWRARYRDANGKKHAKHFDRKVDAQRWVDEVTASIVTGQYVDPRAARITFQGVRGVLAAGSGPPGVISGPRGDHARLGHATAAETLDTYSHLWPDSEDQTRQAIDTVLGAPADSLRTDRAGEQ